MSSRWKFGFWIAGGAILGIVAALLVVSVLISRRSRDWIQEWLSHEYNSQVELSSFSVTIPFPLIQIEAGDVTLHFQGRQDLPPLIFIKRLTIRTSIWGLLRNTRRISFVQLRGLQLNIPPRENTSGGAGAKSAMRKFHEAHFDEILADGARLKILTTKPGKEPLEFDIRQLHLSSSGAEDALAFKATLSNPKPPGEIVSSGVFGPWNADAPSQTPVSGNYSFDNADLSVFPGIAGILSSKGNYQGVLEKINVDGATDTPDFQVRLAGHRVHLSTTFHAIVDGTNGDTYLRPVEARVGNTILVAQGSVEGKAGTKGKTVTLDISASRARIEDLLLLAVKDPPAMTGPIRLKTKYVLVPGPKQLPDRLGLDGSFDLNSLRFTNSAVQQKVDNMSKRGEGRPNEVVNPDQAIQTDDVVSVVEGNFRLENGILTLAGLNYEIPGAGVQLSGTYALGPETLDLFGKLTMKAKLSQTTTGVKSFLLKFADPLFSKGHKGTVLPFKITGSIQHPHYGLALRHKAEAAKQIK